MTSCSSAFPLPQAAHRAGCRETRPHATQPQRAEDGREARRAPRVTSERPQRLQLQRTAACMEDVRRDNTQLRAQLRALRTARNGAEALNAELWRKYNGLQSQLATAEAAKAEADERVARAVRSSKRFRVSQATDQDVHAEVGAVTVAPGALLSYPKAFSLFRNSTTRLARDLALSAAGRRGK